MGGEEYSIAFLGFASHGRLASVDEEEMAGIGDLEMVSLRFVSLKWKGEASGGVGDGNCSGIGAEEN
nr:hypothetical protein Iba_chr12aCG22590 [Ipomoea batatas]